METRYEQHPTRPEMALQPAPEPRPDALPETVFARSRSQGQALSSPDFWVQNVSFAGLPQLAQMFGVGGIWVKDESERLQLNSFKVLGGSYAVYKYIKSLLKADEERLMPNSRRPRSASNSEKSLLPPPLTAITVAASPGRRKAGARLCCLCACRNFKAAD